MMLYFNLATKQIFVCLFLVSSAGNLVAQSKREVIRTACREHQYSWLPDSTFVTLGPESLLVWEKMMLRNPPAASVIGLRGKAFVRLGQTATCKHFLQLPYHLTLYSFKGEFAANTADSNLITVDNFSDTITVMAGEVKKVYPPLTHLVYKKGKLVSSEKITDPARYATWRMSYYEYHNVPMQKIIAELDAVYPWQFQWPLEQMNLKKRISLSFFSYEPYFILLNRISQELKLPSFYYKELGENVISLKIPSRTGDHDR